MIAPYKYNKEEVERIAGDCHNVLGFCRQLRLMADLYYTQMGPRKKHPSPKEKALYHEHDSFANTLLLYADVLYCIWEKKRKAKKEARNDKVQV